MKYKVKCLLNFETGTIELGSFSEERSKCYVIKEADFSYLESLVLAHMLQAGDDRGISCDYLDNLTQEEALVLLLNLSEKDKADGKVYSRQSLLDNL